MSSTTRNIIGGLGGAIALTLLNEKLRQKETDVPRLNLLGEEALTKTLHKAGLSIPSQKENYQLALVGDIVGNAMYYSLIGGKKGNYIWPKAIFFGLSAGFGALKLPQPLGLDPTPVTKTTQTKVLTVGYYVVGALVTGLIIKALK